MWTLYPLPIFIVVTAVLFAVLIAGRRLFPGTFRVRRAFTCPLRAAAVNVDFKEAVWDDALVDVTSCSEFSPPENVQCEKNCLKLQKESLRA